MTKNRKMWAAAAIVAGVLVAQSAMADPSREYEPVAKNFDQQGSLRGTVSTETAREYEPVALTIGGGSARRGQVMTERIGAFRTFSFSLGGIRKVWLGW